MADEFDELTREQLIAELRLARAGLKRLIDEGSHAVLGQDDDLARVELEAQARHIRELHSALEGARAQQSALYDSAPVALVTIDALGRIKEANLAASALFDRDPAQLVGRSVAQFMTAEPGSRFRLAISLASERPLGPIDLEVVQRNGHVVPVTVLGQRVSTHAQRPDVRSTLAFVETRVTTPTPGGGGGLPEPNVLLDAIRDVAIFAIDASHTVLTWNAGAERLLGYAPTDILRQPATRFSMQDDREERAFERECAAALQGRTIAVERWFARSDGSRVWLAGSAGPLVDGLARHVVYALRDETERRMTNDERERMLRDEQRARQQAEAASRTKDEFLARVSHELRTPLSAMSLWVELLADSGHCDANAISALDVALRAETRIVDDLLDISRGIHGKLGMRPERVDLVMAIETTIESLEPQAETRGVTIDLHAPDELWMVGDLGRLQQAVANLLSNAIKFSLRGGRIDVVVGRRGDDCLVRIRDEGQGIAPTFLPRVFEPFAQSASSSNATGLGLGLAIVKQIVELHGGTVTAESPGVGLGSTFTLKLPVRDVAASEPVVTESQQPRPLTGLRALVIEDEQSVREALVAFLERHGLAVQTAANADEARARIQHERPDVILCDVAMPGEDGLSLIRRMREAEKGSASVPIPAAAITARTALRDRAAAIAAGFQAYLTKPVDTRELMDTISRLAQRRPAN